MAPYGGTSHQRSVRNGRVAKEGRNILREWKRQNDYAKFLRGEKEPEDVPSDDDGQPQAEEKVVRRGGVVDQDELLKLAAELAWKLTVMKKRAKKMTICPELRIWQHEHTCNSDAAWTM